MNTPTESTQVPNILNKPFFPFILGSVGMLLILGLLAATNPKPEAYAEYVARKLKQTTCQKKNLPTLTQVSCASLSIFPHRVSEQILQSYIYQEKHTLYSVYSIETLGLRDRSIGIAGQFFDSSSFVLDR